MNANIIEAPGTERSVTVRIVGEPHRFATGDVAFRLEIFLPGIGMIRLDVQLQREDYRAGGGRADVWRIAWPVKTTSTGRQLTIASLSGRLKTEAFDVMFGEVLRRGWQDGRS